MSAVKNVVFIDGCDASTMSFDQYLRIIGDRQRQVDTLKKSPAKASASIKKKITAIEADIKDITVLMDKYHGQDD